MFDNVGKKIKKFAKATFIVETIAAIISGIVMICSSEYLVLYGFITMLCGPFVALISAWFIYGYGELIDKACDIERNTRGERKKSGIQSANDDARLEKLEKLRAEGLITEEEYKEAILK